MKTANLLKFASQKPFVVNRHKRSQEKLRSQCLRLEKAGRLVEVEKTHEQVMYRTPESVEQDAIAASHLHEEV